LSIASSSRVWTLKHAAIRGRPGSHERVGLLVVLAVGEEDDHGRGVRPGRHRIELRRGGPVVVEALGRVLGSGDCLERGLDPVRQRGPPLWTEAVDRGRHRKLIARRRLHRVAAVAEGDDPDLDARRLLLDERAGRFLGGLHARRLKVGRGHAARDVEGEDHRPFEPRQAHRRLWASQRNHADGESE
jgi:hypothetical protein